MISLAEHANPMNPKKMAFGWEPYEELVFVTCEPCLLDFLTVMEEFYSEGKR
jgi:hypothetical protein